MARTLNRMMLGATCLVALLVFADVEKTSAADCGYYPSQHGLFYNYYVGPGHCGYGVPAQLYLSPRPTPPWVGHTYSTYQPLMPHEMLYKHHRLYIRRHPDGGGTRTKVVWH
jgi:hypothetical protein